MLSQGDTFQQTHQTADKDNSSMQHRIQLAKSVLLITLPEIVGGRNTLTVINTELTQWSPSSPAKPPEGSVPGRTRIPTFRDTARFIRHLALSNRRLGLCISDADFPSLASIGSVSNSRYLELQSPNGDSDVPSANKNYRHQQHQTRRHLRIQR